MNVYLKILVPLILSVNLADSILSNAAADIVVPDEPGSEYPAVFYADDQHVYKRRCSPNTEVVERTCVQEGPLAEFGGLPPLMAMSISAFRRRYIQKSRLVDSNGIPEKYIRNNGIAVLNRDIEITETYLRRGELGATEQQQARDRLDALRSYKDALSASRFLNEELFSDEIFYLFAFDGKYSSINSVFDNGYTDIILRDRSTGMWWAYLGTVTPRQALDLNEGTSSSFGCKGKFGGEIAKFTEVRYFTTSKSNLDMLRQVWKLDEDYSKLWDGDMVGWYRRSIWKASPLTYTIKYGYIFPGDTHRVFKAEPKRGVFEDQYDTEHAKVLCVIKPK